MPSQRAFTGPDLQDAGLYLRGLVQLMAADAELATAEHERIRSWAVGQGFDTGFVDEAIGSVLQNQHFPRTPPRFHRQEVARAFLEDAVGLAVCDGVLHPREEAFLLDVARTNGIDPAEVIQALAGLPMPRA